MIGQIINLKDYDWKIKIFYNTNINDKDIILDELKNICNDKKFINKAKQNIEYNSPNTGFIYTNYNTRQSLINIGHATSKKEFIDTIVHEANHLQSHIATYYNLNEKGEEVSYLIGYIVKQMYLVFRKLI